MAIQEIAIRILVYDKRQHQQE